LTTVVTSFEGSGTRASGTRTLSTVTSPYQGREERYVRLWPLDRLFQWPLPQEACCLYSSSHWLVWPMISSLNVVGSAQLPFVLLGAGLTSTSTDSA